MKYLNFVLRSSSKDLLLRIESFKILKNILHTTLIYYYDYIKIKYYIYGIFYFGTLKHFCSDIVYSSLLLSGVPLRHPAFTISSGSNHPLSAPYCQRSSNIYRFAKIGNVAYLEINFLPRYKV